MKFTYIHNVATSFQYWFDHTLCSKGEAFFNLPLTFHHINDTRLPDSIRVFASPFKQFVADSSIEGADIISSVVIDGVVYNKGDAGLKIDYENGRVLVNASEISESAIITGNAAIKDLNVYTASEREEDIILENRYSINSRFGKIEETPIPAYSYVLPACFLLYTGKDNEPFEFGGRQDSKTMVRVVIKTPDFFHLNGCASIFTDTLHRNIPYITSSKAPFNEFGDIKSSLGGIYNYNTDILSVKEDMIHIEKVKFSTIKGLSQDGANQSLFTGLLDFHLSHPRYTS